MSKAEPTQNDHLVLRLRGHIAEIEINRPEKRNALSQAMWQGLAALVDRAASSKDTRAIVIRGAGADFSAGADIGEFDEVRRDAPTAKAYEATNSTAFAAIRKCAVPTIAEISGICFGGGFGIAAACDLRIAAEDATFAVPAARLGLAYPHDAMADIVHSCGPQFATYLTFTGARLGATDAMRIGFLAEICHVSHLRQRVADIANQIASAAPLSIRASKAAIAAVLSGNPDDARIAREAGAATFGSADYQEGRKAFREKRAPAFRGF